MKALKISQPEIEPLLASTAGKSRPPALDDDVQKLLACLAPGSAPSDVQDYMADLIQTEGLLEFVELRLPVFNRAVGDAWAGGRIGTHAEHHYTEAVMATVQSHLLGRQPTHFQVRILLTTPPGELHGLGLLAVQAALTLQGADCFNLGVQTPVSEVVQAVKDWDITLLAISASIVLRPHVARSYLQELRSALPKGCKIWAGGEGYSWLRASSVAGVQCFQSTSQAVKAWQKMTRGVQTPVASNPQVLRRHAAARARTEASQSAGGELPLSPEALQKTLYELQVHQIEIEMQNEELRQTQRRLDAERERYFGLYDLAPVGYCTVSPKGLILKANLTLASMLRLARATLSEQALSRFILPQDQDAFYLLLRRSMQTQEPQECDVRLVLPGDAHRWVHLQAVLAGDEAGGWRVRLALSDITELKKVQQELIDSEQRYRTLTDRAPVPLIVHDGKQIVYVNAAAIRMFGASSATELLGTEMFRLVHPDFREVARQRVRLSIEQAGSLSAFEYKLLKLDGSTLAVEVQSTSVMFDGAPSVQVAMNDVTERRDFSKRQLAAVEDERKRISREVHDQVGQVFTAIKLIVQSLPRDALPKEQGSAIMQALEMGIAATRKITAELRPPLLDDLGLAAALDRLCGQMLGVVNLDFEIDVASQEALDANQALSLFRIAQEALTNVLKHAAAKHVTISGRRGNNEYVFRIKDDGRGLKSRNTRADAMGVAGMQERARIMGGRCTIESNSKKGTLVEVDLPLNGAHEHEPAAC